MNDFEYLSFVKYVLENGGDTIVAENKKHMIKDMKKLYAKYKKDPKTIKVKNENREPCMARLSEAKGKGEGVAVFVMLYSLYCLGEGIYNLSTK